MNRRALAAVIATVACSVAFVPVVLTELQEFRPRVGGVVRQAQWPDDLQVVVEITPDIEDMYSRCVAVLTVAEVPSHICEGLIK